MDARQEIASRQKLKRMMLCGADNLKSHGRSLQCMRHNVKKCVAMFSQVCFLNTTESKNAKEGKQ